MSIFLPPFVNTWPIIAGVLRWKEVTIAEDGAEFWKNSARALVELARTVDFQVAVVPFNIEV